MVVEGHVKMRKQVHAIETLVMAALLAAAIVYLFALAAFGG